MKLPGIDTKKIIESRRKDIEALLSANERAFAAWEALTRKQAELMNELVKEWQTGAKDVLAKSGSKERINEVAAHAQHAFVNAVAVMKDMAEIAAKSSLDVVSILNKRYHEGLEELRGVIGTKQ
jgi:phasin family protein